MTHRVKMTGNRWQSKSLSGLLNGTGSPCCAHTSLPFWNKIEWCNVCVRRTKAYDELGHTNSWFYSGPWPNDRPQNWWCGKNRIKSTWMLALDSWAYLGRRARYQLWLEVKRIPNVVNIKVPVRFHIWRHPYTRCSGDVSNIKHVGRIFFSPNS